jgi:hypothetical protein
MTDLDEVKRQNVAEFLNRQAMKRDHPERLILADAMGDLMQYEHEDKYAAAFGLLSRLTAHGVTLAEARATPLSLDVLVRRLSRDWHNRSTRPCPTCDPISETIGEPFGCAAFRIEEVERQQRRLTRPASDSGEPPA